MIAKFTAEDLARANSDWGCSCGPAAFAFACGLTLDQARRLFPTFRGWCNTRMMRTALYGQPLPWAQHELVDKTTMFNACTAIVRIEFTGPWTGTQWAAHHSHWIATFRGKDYDGRMVYDVNSGVIEMTTWEQEWLPQMLKAHKRSTGWRPTNIMLIGTPTHRFA